MEITLQSSRDVKRAWWAQALIESKRERIERGILSQTDVGGDKIHTLIMAKNDVIKLHRFLADRCFNDI